MKKILMMCAVALVALGAWAEYTDDCITFSSAEAFTLKTANGQKNWYGTLWTSTNKVDWTEWKGGEVSAAQTGGMYNLYVRGDTNNTKIAGLSEACRWVLTGSNIACSGNIETLRGATGDGPSPTQMTNYCYSYMFSGCTSLTRAPELPATKLKDHCYSEMFYGCTSLTKAPSLPATTLAEYCYRYMFSDCTSLTDAPALPATTLDYHCYFSMFRGCTSLTNAPVLPAMTLAERCYDHMFSGCTSLTRAPELPATKLEDHCYCQMFSDCTALTNAPVLPATTLADNCYFGMFEGCTALEVNTEAPGKEWKIPATSTTASNWGTDMFKGTKGKLQGQPDLNTTYYIKSALPPGSKGEPWKIGAGEDDTVAAWTNGTTLVVQGAGKMKAFASDGSDIPWPVAQITAVDISGDVTSIGQNAWLGLADGVSYNGLSATAAKTMGNGFGGTSQYARTAFREFLVNGASIIATVALETAQSLTNERTEVELKASEVALKTDASSSSTNPSRSRRASTSCGRRNRG